MTGRCARAVVAAAAVALLGACSSTAGNSDSSDTVSVGTTPSAATRASAVRDWFDGISADFAALQTDLNDIGTAAGDSDVATLESACEALKTDVVTLEADPQAPDPEIRSDLAHALDSYSTAATECLAGDYESAAGDTNTGTEWIHRTTTRVNDLS